MTITSKWCLYLLTVLFSIIALQPANSDICYEKCKTGRNECIDTYIEKYKNELDDCQGQQTSELLNCMSTWRRNRANCALNYFPGCYRSVDADWAACRTQANTNYQNCSGVKQFKAHFNDCYKTEDDCRLKCDKQAKCEQGQNEDADECKRVAGDGDSEISRRTTNCPPGTRPNLLGICVATFASGQKVPPGEGGCEPGTRPGPDDRCVPIIKIPVAPLEDGVFAVMCPFGTKPSPIDGGCVVDPGPDAEGTRFGDEPRCPPGTAPAPDDGGCVPVVTTVNDYFQRLEMFRSIRSEERDLSEETVTKITTEALRILVTDDPARALEKTAEAIGMPLE